jgi:hypothetical protein
MPVERVDVPEHWPRTFYAQGIYKQLRSSTPRLQSSTHTQKNQVASLSKENMRKHYIIDIIEPKFH